MKNSDKTKEQLLNKIRLIALLVALFLYALPLFAQKTKLQEKKIVIGVARGLAPYSFLDENGLAVGYSIDITNAIAQVMHLDIEIIIAPFGELRQALKNGEIDAMPMYYSENRKKIVDFTSPYSTVHNAIFIRKDSPTIETEEELLGKKIIVINGDIMHDYVLENNITDKLVKVSMESEALKLLSSGDYDCALMAQLPGLYWVNNMKLENIVTVGPLMVPSEICYAVTKGNTALRDLLSEGLATLGETGEHKRIHDKWLGILIPIGVSQRTVWRYIIYAVVPLLLLIGIITAWSQTLKKQVIKRTRELSESEERFRTISENAPVLINSFDEDGRCLFWNKQCHKTFGWTIEEINSHDVALALFYPDPDVCEEVIRTVTSDPDGHFREWHPITKNGKILSTMWANFRLPNGQVFSMGHDITDQKKAEHQIKESATKWESTFNAMSDSVSIIDNDGYLIDYNLVTLKMFNISEKEIKTKHCWEMVHNLSEPIADCPIVRMRKSNQSESMIFLEGKRWLEVSVDPIYDSDGNINGAIHVVSDITKRKRIEEELTKHHEHLEEMVKERTKELEDKNKELEQYNKLFADREFRIKELKDKIKELEEMN